MKLGASSVYYTIAKCESKTNRVIPETKGNGDDSDEVWCTKSMR